MSAGSLERSKHNPGGISARAMSSGRVFRKENEKGVFVGVLEERMISTQTQRKLKPIYIYDHLPDILCGYPALACLALVGLSLPVVQRIRHIVLSAHTLFWIGLVVVLAWFTAFRYNRPKLDSG